MIKRDSQRGKVWKLIADKGTPLTLAERQKFANMITKSRWWGSRDPKHRKVQLAVSLHGCVPQLSYDAITISMKCATDLKVIEALAHGLAKQRNPDLPTWHHGPAFALIFLNMVKRFVPEKYEDIRYEYSVRKIKRKTVSDDAKLDAQTRYAKAQLQQMIGELTGE